MAPGTASAPTVESKSAKKKRGKSEARPTSSSGTATPAADENSHTLTSDPATNGVDGAQDSPYLKELNKSIRNIAKKLTASSKTESIAADNPGLSLDELVATKKINADQKAQILKRPALQADLARLQDQVIQYRKFGKDYEDRFAKEKSALEESHAEALAKAKLEAADEATTTLLKKFDEDLLVLSQFLHAAAAKRQDDDLDPVEKAAFEGVLLLVYQGNNAALAAFKDIAAGSDKKVSNTEGDQLDFTYAQVKETSINDAPSAVMDEPATASPVEDTAAPDAVTDVTTDPTIANAGMTELQDTITYQATDEPAVADTMVPPEQSSITANAANAVAERSWDPQASMTSDSPSGEGWVEVPRDPAETETGVAATPAAVHNSTSWAEEVNADAAADEKPTRENDGFEQVVHHQNRGRGRGHWGEFRGRGRGGDQRGRGRGDGDRRGGGRGRGRGGEGGFRGGNRGGRGRDGSGPKPDDNGGGL
ncbi:hypothetical protein GJ744_009673 [Endocarpon pusillum]|uniref:YAG7-like dimerisation domain-containing protein n=1 Tax=Endocarpon pusillum TaxID=364733 RepID=A0A8H7E608_9EURO|nr:hypothetical protein GJ744_009673 [Endocarpon pusillum]